MPAQATCMLPCLKCGGTNLPEGKDRPVCPDCGAEHWLCPVCGQDNCGEDGCIGGCEGI